MSDSSSESELLTTKNLVTFQNESTIVSVKGPNINTTNLTGLSFQNNVFTSTLNRPRNNEWQRRALSNCGQRSIGYRRETSPMSVVSACDARQRNYSRWDDTRGMNSQRSVYNGRGGFPVPMRSVDSNPSDIAMAIKNKQFNKYGIQIIKEACNQFYKHKTRKRIEKRRNLKLFLKGYLRKSGHESGELASDSSISSDDNRTTRGSNHKDKSCCRSTKTDVSDLRKSSRYDNQLKDCTDDLKQSSMRSMVGGPANTKATDIIKAKPADMNSTDKLISKSRTLLSDNVMQPPSLPAKKKVPDEIMNATNQSNKIVQSTPNNTVQKSVKTFWDTDFESEAEGTPTTRRDDFKNLCLSSKSESNTNTKANNNKNRNQNARSNNSNGS